MQGVYRQIAPYRYQMTRRKNLQECGRPHSDPSIAVGNEGNSRFYADSRKPVHNSVSSIPLNSFDIFVMFVTFVSCCYVRSYICHSHIDIVTYIPLSFVCQILILCLWPSCSGFVTLLPLLVAFVLHSVTYLSHLSLVCHFCHMFSTNASSHYL